MIKVYLFTGPADNLTGYCVEGHAGCAPAGEDIVCAAISVLAQTTALGLLKVVGVEPVIEVREGYFSCDLSGALLRGEKQELSRVLLETMVCGVEETAGEYPGIIKIIYNKH